MLRNLTRWLVKGIHPTGGSLIAFADGALSPITRKFVDVHLRNCTRCQREMESMRRDLRLFQLFVQAGPSQEALEMGLTELRGAMRQVRISGAHPCRNTDPTVGPRQRFVEELETYLGRRATQRLLGRLDRDDRLLDMLPVAEPMLAALLGRKAATTILTRTLETERPAAGAT